MASQLSSAASTRIERAIATLTGRRGESLRLLSNYSPNKRTRESLQPHCVLRFNGSMKAKIFSFVIAAGCILVGEAFGQTLQIKGIVLPETTAHTIVLQAGPEMKLPCASGTWVIAVTPTTTVAPSPVPSTTVTVQCKSIDAQRKENPMSSPCPSLTTSSATPTPTPTSG